VDELGPVRNELDVDFTTPQAVRQGVKGGGVPLAVALSMLKVKALRGDALGIVLEAVGKRRKIAPVMPAAVSIRVV
jgi:hypothetical protein